MKVLILGGSGMLGHKLWQMQGDRFDTYVTLRCGFESYSPYGLFRREHTLDRVSTEDFDSVVQAVGSVQPAVVVNCIGVVKQSEAGKDPVNSIAVNSLFPHRLARVCREKGIRLIQISTDCVFSGRKGGYSETDECDAEDLYGRTKLLGEVSGNGCLSLRTSMIGRELETSHGLLEWFLSQDGGTIHGYSRAIFSGLTTRALCDILAAIMRQHPGLSGVYHVASEPISKFDLLMLIKQVYGLHIRIDPDETMVCDRSLDGTRFRQATGLMAPAWPEMIREMHDDPTPYARIRGFCAK